MNYQTDLIPISVQILQSLLYNAQKDITKIKIDIEFDDEQNYNRFMNIISPPLKQGQEYLQSSDSDEMETQTQIIHDVNWKNQQYILNQKCLVQDLSRLQLSIILKENYKKEIKEIQERNNVRILIVPQKIKYFGHDEDQISEAKCQVHDIKTNILINTLDKFGREVFQSSYYKLELNKCNLHIGKLAEKYYYWWDELQTERGVIEETIKRFIPLFDRYENLRRKFNAKYIDGLVKMNGKLFKQFLEGELNDDKCENHKVELNELETEIIVHVQVQDQRQIIEHEIKKFYGNLIQFFMNYKSRENQQIQNIQEICKIFNDKGLFWCRYEDLIVVSFDIKSLYRSNQSITVLSINNKEFENRVKQFAQSLKPIIELNMGFTIQYFSQQDPKQGELQQNQYREKITSEYKKYDGIMMLSPKTLKTQTFIKIIQNLILSTKYKSNKSKFLDSSQDKIQKNSQFIDGNGGSFIDDTSSRVDGTESIMSHEKSMLKVLQNGQKNKHDRMNILDELRQNEILKNYNFLIKDQQGDSKYNQKSNQIQKQKSLLSQQLTDHLYQVTKYKYKCYNVSIPLKQKPMIPTNEDLVTVFILDDNKKQIYIKQYISILLMNHSRDIAHNGWLVNVSKSKIIEKDFKYQLCNGFYQVIKFVKYIGK